MVDILMKHQRLVMIQFVLFAVLFGSVLVISAVIYNKTTIYDLEQAETKKDLAKSLEKSFAIKGKQ